MTIDHDDPERQRKARALALQRQRRQGVKRIDYHPNAWAFAIITAKLNPYVGGDSSSVIDGLILKAAEVAPELMHTSREREIESKRAEIRASGLPLYTARVSWLD